MWYELLVLSAVMPDIRFGLIWVGAMGLDCLDWACYSAVGPRAWWPRRFSLADLLLPPPAVMTAPAVCSSLNTKYATHPY